MKRAGDELSQLLNYEKLSAIRLLELPKIEKHDIPNYILCPKFDKANAKIDQTMERYNSKVNSIQQEIDAQREVLDNANRKTKYGCNTSDAQSVARYNDWIDRGRRALEKYNEAVEKHNEAIGEAKEKLQQLEQEALNIIDEDIVAVLDKCTRAIEKLSGSQNTEYLAAAIEICLMELRIFALFEDNIEGNAARKDCRDRIADANRLFTALCANENVRNYLSDLFRRNVHLVQKNGEVYSQIVKSIESNDGRQLATLTQSVVAVLEEKYDTNFKYQGVVDPTELEALIVKMRSTIEALKQGIAKGKDVAATTSSVAQAAVSAHKNAETLLASMKSNVEGMKNDILSAEHFACQMIEEAVIDDFYQKDLRPAVTALRQHLVGAVGEEQIDALVLANEDLFALVKADNAIKQANLIGLQAEWDKIDGHVKVLSDLIIKAEEDIVKAGEVPQQNADALRQELGTKYMLSCIPALGIAFAAAILSRIKTYQPAFSSTNQIYKNLGSDLLVKNSKMSNMVMVIGGLLGVCALVFFLAIKPTPNMAINVGVPGAILVLYFITVALLMTAGNKLRTYVGTAPSAFPEVVPVGGEAIPKP